MHTHIEKEASHIADAIVKLVERTDGPGAQVEREVAGWPKMSHPHGASGLSVVA